jgi:hypothetical protein
LLLDAPEDAGLKGRRDEAMKRHAATVPAVPPPEES